jgi:hypothetical protein
MNEYNRRSAWIALTVKGWVPSLITTMELRDSVILV